MGAIHRRLFYTGDFSHFQIFGIPDALKSTPNIFYFFLKMYLR